MSPDPSSRPLGAWLGRSLQPMKAGVPTTAISTSSLLLRPHEYFVELQRNVARISNIDQILATGHRSATSCQACCCSVCATIRDTRIMVAGAEKSRNREPPRLPALFIALVRPLIYSRLFSSDDEPSFERQMDKATWREA